MRFDSDEPICCAAYAVTSMPISTRKKPRITIDEKMIALYTL